MLPYRKRSVKVAMGEGFFIEDFSLDPSLKEEKEKKKEISYDATSLLSFEEIKELTEKYILPTYNRLPISFHYGSGEYLFDGKGKRYIDFLSGIAVVGLGHANPDLVETLIRQADLLWHTSNLFYSQEQALLARALIEISFPGKVFFCNSGTEANEAAYKIVRAWGEYKSPKARKVVALEGSFHGRTWASMSLTGQEKVREGFGPLIEDVVFIPPNDIEALERVFDEKVAGIFLEPILGEGGVIPLEKDFLLKAKELTEKYDALLVFDEVQTGIGRTGKYFCYQHYQIVPDILCIGKGLGNGFPIGAVVVHSAYTGVLGKGQHGSTFGGNHLATAVAYEVLRFIEAYRVLSHVEKIGRFFFHRLLRLKEKFPHLIQEVRGKGLLLGMVLREDIEARNLLSLFLEKGLVIGRAGKNVLRFLPPLVVRRKTILEAMEIIEEVLKDLDKKL